MREKKADIILKNANVFTATDNKYYNNALAIANDKIVFIGSEKDALNYVDNNTKVFDLKGNTVLPGFCDSHAHGIMGGRLMNHCLLSTGKTLDDYVSIIKSYLELNSGEENVMGFGWAHAPFGAKGPDKKVLDEIIPDKPAAFLSIDYHSCWVNSEALKLAGINSKTKDPAGGLVERYDATNEPTGCLRESAAINMVLDKMPEPSDEDWQNALRTYQKKAAENGITALFDAGILNHSQTKAIDAISELDRKSEVKMRIVQSYVLDPDKGKGQIDELEKIFKDHKSNKNYQVRTAKIFMDGAIEGHTGFLTQEYSDRKDYYGKSVWQQDIYNETVTELDKRGIQVHVHSIGDGAVKSALDGMQVAESENGKRDSRHALAHIELAARDDVPRFNKLGVFASLQPTRFYMDSNYFEETIPLLSNSRSDRRYMLKDFEDAKVNVAFGSDWPWGNISSNMNPLDGIGTAITRENPDDNMLKPYEPKQRVDIFTALKNYTIEGAKQNFNDKITGTLEIGKKADIAVLDSDIMKMSAEELFKIKVQMTIFDGEIIYQLD